MDLSLFDYTSKSLIAQNQAQKEAMLDYWSTTEKKNRYAILNLKTW